MALHFFLKDNDTMLEQCTNNDSGLDIVIRR